MKQNQATIKVYGKWILAGEHSVLQGYPALAFPLPSQFVEMKWEQSNQPTLIFSKKKESDPSSEFIAVFKNILKKALYKISRLESEVKGNISFKSCVPLGMGLGASAVICVLVGRLFQHFQWLKEEELFSFCHSLENTLHGESSGLDIAAVLKNQPIFYKRTKLPKNTSSDKYLQDQKQPDYVMPEIQMFSPQWQPKIFLSHTKSSSSTRESIKQVQIFQKKQPVRAQKLDRQMEESVLKAKQALKNTDADKGLKQMTQSFLLAKDCFVQWNLVNKQMQHQIDLLMEKGALAVKPTGSGAGGCLLSLWDKQPPVLKVSLISAF